MFDALIDAEREARRLLALRDQRIQTSSKFRRWVFNTFQYEGIPYSELLEPTADELRLMAAYERNIHRWNGSGETLHLPLGLICNVFLSGYAGASGEKNYRVRVTRVLRELFDSGSIRANPHPPTEAERRLALMGVA